MKKMSNGYYFSVNEAFVELGRRRSLRQQIIEYWGVKGVVFPRELITGEPLAVIGRHVATFRYEDALFIWMATAVGFRPTWLTYVEDKFSTASKVKISLLHPYMTSRLNKVGGHHVNKRRLTNQGLWIGHPLSSVMTESGKTLMDFHGRRLSEACPEALVVDISYANRGWGGKASTYYQAYLSLFLAHSVLFEDYHGGESGAVLGGFTKTVFEPAFQVLVERFGVRPIIVPLPWLPELAYHPEGEFLSNWRNEPSFNKMALQSGV